MKRDEKGFGLVEAILILVVVALIGFVGWYILNHDNSGPYNDNKKIDFKRLTIGSAPGNGQNVKPQLIEDQATFETVWKKLYASNQPPEIPQVDFNINSLILVTYASSSGGYSISINKLAETPKSLVVDYMIEEPGDNCISTQSLAQVYELATIPKTSKDTSFKQSKRTLSC